MGSGPEQQGLSEKEVPFVDSLSRDRVGKSSEHLVPKSTNGAECDEELEARHTTYTHVMDVIGRGGVIPSAGSSNSRVEFIYPILQVRFLGDTGSGSLGDGRFVASSRYTRCAAGT